MYNIYNLWIMLLVESISLYLVIEIILLIRLLDLLDDIFVYYADPARELLKE